MTRSRKVVRKGLRKMAILQQNQGIVATLLLILLTLNGCSSALESFDSGATSGVGAKSISEVNAMIDQGKIAGIKADGDFSKVIAPVIVQNPVAIAHPPLAHPETITLSDNSVIQRQPEQHLRVWFAPFQDFQGNFHEAAVVHTLLRPSYWQMNDAN